MSTPQASRLRRVPLGADRPLEALTAIAAHVTPERIAEGDTRSQQDGAGARGSDASASRSLRAITERRVGAARK